MMSLTSSTFAHVQNVVLCYVNKVSIIDIKIITNEDDPYLTAVQEQFAVTTKRGTIPCTQFLGEL